MECVVVAATLYQAITVVDLRNGMDTSFWYDAWFNEDAMGDRFPAIQSLQEKTAFQLPKCLPPASLIPLFVPRLSPQAKCRTPSTAEHRLSGGAQ
jgi:hypothetical protein